MLLQLLWSTAPEAQLLLEFPCVHGWLLPCADSDVLQNHLSYLSSPSISSNLSDGVGVTLGRPRRSPGLSNFFFFGRLGWVMAK